MEIVETAGGIVVDSRDSWMLMVESVISVEGSWSRGSYEWAKTAMS